MNKITEIYDVETLSNLFTYSAVGRDSDNVVKFVIWKGKNEIYDLLVHLTNVKGMIGFNSINFDYPVMHYIIKERDKLLKLDGDKVAKLIYKKAQSVISQEYSAIKEDEVLIPQLDLFRIWHMDNKARMSSLKKIMINMRFENVQDMPYPHDYKITKESEVIEILDYNINDIFATKKFYEKTIEKLDLRKGLQTKYNLNCLNYPDSKIGEQLMLKLYCEATNQDENNVKKLRTYRNSFKFIDCIPEYIKFYTPEFNELLEYLKGIEVKELKESFKYEFNHFDLNLHLGTGGAHFSAKPGIYEASENIVIYDADVSGMYPSIAVVNNLYPEHLGKEFPVIYNENVLKPRLHAKEKINGKMRDKVMAEGYKLSGNSVYGKSNSEYSFLYDPLYTLKTTLTGQLVLCMLTELFIIKIPNVKILGINTDGLTLMFDKKHTDLYFKICNYWQEKTMLNLEYVNYSKMVIRDVNNYISLSTHEMFHTNGELILKEKDGTKYKGTFKPVSEMLKDGEYHKNFSQNAVTLAVSDYFLSNIPVEESLRNNKNIYDFCKTFNATHGWTCDTSDIEYKDISYSEAVGKLTDKGWYEAYAKGFFISPNSGNLGAVHLLEEGNKTKLYKNVVKQQKTNRYYISKNGKTFRKIKDDKIIEIEAGGNLVVIFNRYDEKEFEEYNIDYDYYIKECEKIIFTIDGTNERLEIERKELALQKKKDKEEENYIKFCVNKIPTTLQYQSYNREWLQEKYGIPVEIKPSKTKN